MTDAPHDLRALRMNARGAGGSLVGLTEIRGPFYDSFGPSYLSDLLDTVGEFVDLVKMPAPSLLLLDPAIQRRFIDTIHAHGCRASAGGAVEWVLTRGRAEVDRYFEQVADLGYDVVEVSAGMLAIADDDFQRLVKRAAKTGMSVKAEVGIQFGAGATSSEAQLERNGTLPVSWALRRARLALESGADLIVLESEGVTESVSTWRTDVPVALAGELGLDRLLFEAADPAVYAWYIKTFGPGVSLFVDHSQALHLESLRSGVWAGGDLWGRIVSYPRGSED